MYQEAARILDAVHKKKGTAKSLCLSSKWKNKKQVYALVCETLKYTDVVDSIVKTTDLIKLEKSLKDEQNLARVMVYDFLFGVTKKKADGGKKSVLWPHKNALSTALARLKVKAGVTKNEDLLPEHVRMAGKTLPRYVRINRLKTSQQSVILKLKDEGYEQVTCERNWDSFASVVKSLHGKQFLHDIHVPNLLVFPPGTDFHNHHLYKEGKIILQDKASCLPARFLMPPPGGAVIDCCAAPGNKTTHAADLMRNSGRIFAFDLSSRRCETMKQLVSTAGANIIDVQNMDFLKVDPKDEKYAEVEYVIVDPSCSGSGIESRLNSLTDDADSVSEERIEKLSQFQISILAHALSFPNVKRLVYSTCSIHARENEHVVKMILARFLDFELVDMLPEWTHRGLEEYYFADKCIRADKGDFTNGFFVAVFQKKKCEFSVKKRKRKRKPRKRRLEQCLREAEAKKESQEENNDDQSLDAAVDAEESEPEPEKKKRKTEEAKEEDEDESDDSVSLVESENDEIDDSFFADKDVKKAGNESIEKLRKRLQKKERRKRLRRAERLLKQEEEKRQKETENESTKYVVEVGSSNVVVDQLRVEAAASQVLVDDEQDASKTVTKTIEQLRKRLQKKERRKRLRRAGSLLKQEEEKRQKETENESTTDDVVEIGSSNVVVDKLRMETAAALVLEDTDKNASKTVNKAIERQLGKCQRRKERRQRLRKAELLKREEEKLQKETDLVKKLSSNFVVDKLRMEAAASLVLEDISRVVRQTGRLSESHERFLRKLRTGSADERPGETSGEVRYSTSAEVRNSTSAEVGRSTSGEIRKSAGEQHDHSLDGSCCTCRKEIKAENLLEIDVMNSSKKKRRSSKQPSKNDEDVIEEDDSEAGDEQFVTIEDNDDDETSREEKKRNRQKRNYRKRDLTDENDVSEEVVPEVVSVDGDDDGDDETLKKAKRKRKRRGKKLTRLGKGDGDVSEVQEDDVEQSITAEDSNDDDEDGGGRDGGTLKAKRKRYRRKRVEISICIKSEDRDDCPEISIK